MSDNSRAYDDAKNKVILAGKSSETFAQQFIGALSGRVEPAIWNHAIKSVLNGMAVVMVLLIAISAHAQIEMPPTKARVASGVSSSEQFLVPGIQSGRERSEGEVTPGVRANFKKRARGWMLTEMALPVRGASLKPSTHFFDTPRIVSTSLNFSLRTVDTINTCHNFNRPGFREEILPTQSCAGVAAFSYGFAFGSLGAERLLYKHHPRLARIPQWISIAGAVSGIAYTYARGAR